MSIKNITKWNKMTLKNSYMFRLVMEKNNLCKPLIERILGSRLSPCLMLSRKRALRLS